MLLLDTHVWLWHAGDPSKLSKRVRSRIENASQIAISAMSCWEVAMLIERGRLRLRPNARAGIRDALAIPKLRVEPVTDLIALEAGLLGSSFHGDPADRMIVATALAIGATLVTKDDLIRNSGLVTTLW